MLLKISSSLSLLPLWGNCHSGGCCGRVKASEPLQVRALSTFSLSPSSAAISHRWLLFSVGAQLPQLFATSKSPGKALCFCSTGPISLYFQPNFPRQETGCWERGSMILLSRFRKPETLTGGFLQTTGHWGQL